RHWWTEGNRPATSTSGIDFSRWPAFMWQFVHDMPPGARRGASAGVFVNSLNPRRISSESFELSSVLSVSGFRGISQAAFMLIEAAMSGPVILIGDGGGGSAAGRSHAAKASSASANGMWRHMAGLTYHNTHHSEKKSPRSSASPPWPQ